MSLRLVCAVAACLPLLASGSCTTTHEQAGAGAGGKTSGGTGGQNTSGGSGGTRAGSGGTNSGGKGGTSAAGNGGRHGGTGGENVAGSNAGSGGASGGLDATQCDTAADCAYGEIDHEIVKKSDCICRFGCPYIPLNKTTIDRRDASYTKLCDPAKDGQGKPCGVDDCVPLKAALCEDHTCRAAPR